MSDEETTLSDDLAAAWDAEVENAGDADGEPTDSPEVTGENQADEVQAAEEDLQGESGEPESGREVEGGEQEELSLTPDADAGDDAGVEDDSPAPASLSAAAREKWKDTPKEVREQFLKRDKEVAQALRDTADVRKRDQMIGDTLRPYQQLFAMNGNNPPQMIGNLLQTASILQFGSSAQKAQEVARIAQAFSVDIGHLDSALVGDQPQMSPQEQARQIVQQELQQQLQYREQQWQQEQQQTVAQQAQQELAELSKKAEFFADVRPEMIVLLDAAAERGEQLTPQEAYDRAITMNPTVSQIIRSRAEQQSIAKKRKASRSISGSPAGPAAASQNTSLADDLNAAWDAHMG